MSRDRLWFWGFLTVLGLHLVWESANDWPPAWDMAHHQRMGWEYLRAWQQGTLFNQFSSISSYYPPGYYLQEAFILLISGGTTLLPLLANLPGLFLLSYCTLKVAQLQLPVLPASIAAWLPLLFPLVAWSSRESLLDLALAGWVSAAYYLVLKSQFLCHKGLSLLLGLVVAAGTLTKWTFPLFWIPSVLYALWKSRDRCRSAINLLDALLVALPAVFWWYLPNLKSLSQRLESTLAAAVWEQDPGLTTVWGWIYYPRSLSSYYLFLPLTLMAAWSAWQLCFRGRRGGLENFLGFSLLGGLLLLTLVEAKDPRYTMPLVSPLAVLLVLPLQHHRRWLIGLGCLAFVQFLGVSFSLPFTPHKLAVFASEDESDYLSMGREWVFYAPDYFGITGPPRRGNWRYAEILETLSDCRRVGFIPDSPAFHPSALELFAVRENRLLEIVRIGQTQDSLEEIGRVDWVIGKSGWQGISYITRFNSEAYRRLEALRWPRAEIWSLPDQSKAVLWRNPTLSP